MQKKLEAPEFKPNPYNNQECIHETEDEQDNKWYCKQPEDSDLHNDICQNKQESYVVFATHN